MVEFWCPRQIPPGTNVYVQQMSFCRFQVRGRRGYQRLRTHGFPVPILHPFMPCKCTHSFGNPMLSLYPELRAAATAFHCRWALWRPITTRIVAMWSRGELLYFHGCIALRARCSRALPQSVLTVLHFAGVQRTRFRNYATHLWLDQPRTRICCSYPRTG